MICVYTEQYSVAANVDAPIIYSDHLETGLTKTAIIRFWSAKLVRENWPATFGSGSGEFRNSHRKFPFSPVKTGAETWAAEQ